MLLLIILVIVLLSFLKFSVNIFFSWELNGSSLKFFPVELYSLLRKLFRCTLSSGHLDMCSTVQDFLPHCYREGKITLPLISFHINLFQEETVVTSTQFNEECSMFNVFYFFQVVL